MINIPTAITVGRIALIGPLLYCVFAQQYVLYWICFIGACASDWLDGYLARTLKQETQLGALLDPVADKLLVISLCGAFWYTGNPLIPGWFLTLVVLKECTLMVGGLITKIFMPEKIVQAHLPGKLAFVAQVELLVRASVGWTLGVVMGTNILASVLMIYALGYYICVKK